MKKPDDLTLAQVMARVGRDMLVLQESIRREERSKILAELREFAGLVEKHRAKAKKRDPIGTLASAMTPVLAKPAAAKAKKRKNGWAGLTKEARLARVNAIRKGRNLPPRTE